MNSTQVLLIATLCLGGCASDPEWVSAPPKAICFAHADKACIGELIAKSVELEKPGTGRDESMRITTALVAGAGISDPEALVRLRDEMDKVMCRIPDTAYLAAGNAIGAAREKRFTAALDDAAKVQDRSARLLALQHIAALAARSDDEKAIGRSLNSLNDEDKPAYMDALQQRLLTLLSVGDLERAKALQDGLLEFYAGRKNNTMRVAQIAISYATTGHVQDANAFLQRASQKVPGLNAKDMGVLFELVIKASKGEYPPPQDFFAFSSDSMRLEAYVQLAILYDRSGQADYSSRVTSDMARFAQKSSFRVEGGDATRAFSKILIEAM